MCHSARMAPVTTTSGNVSGQQQDGITRYLGIPYAASPTGPLRFAAPAPPPAWDGVRHADAFGPTPPKPSYPAPLDYLLEEPSIPGDDTWLTVNVWTPGGEGGLPVMVWIYGGGFAHGSTAVPMYDGASFARDGVVLVSFNYRIGVDGFACLPDAPANRGLLDQIAALEWVRDNIAAFGGDPGNVTIFGESAGAMSVTTLLAVPRARGLFAKAIAQSGCVQAAAAPGDAQKVAGEIGRALGRPATAAALAEVPLPDLVQAQAGVAREMALGPDPARFGASIVASLMTQIPVVDGELIPEHPMAAIAAGASADIPLLTGTNAEEFRLFLVPSGRADQVTGDTLDAVLAAMGIAPKIAAVYRSNRPGATPGDVLGAILTDRYYRLPALAVAAERERDPAATYLYEFAWRSPASMLGACHAMEIPFVFDNLAARYVDRLTGTEPPQELAGEMHAGWISFARNGNPGWRAFDAAGAVQVFRDDGSAVELDPRADERQVWTAA